MDTDDNNDGSAADLPQAVGLEARIAASIAPTLTYMGFELVRVAVLGRLRPTVQIMADRADGSLINVKDCEDITHAVGAVLDVDDPMPGEWTLEVSSAGIDRPLTRGKDWARFAGHQARAEMAVPLMDGPFAGRRRFTGVALGFDHGNAMMRLDDGSDVALPIQHIRRAKLILTDALIAATAPNPETN